MAALRKDVKRGRPTEGRPLIVLRTGRRQHLHFFDLQLQAGLLAARAGRPGGVRGRCSFLGFRRLGFVQRSGHFDLVSEVPFHLLGRIQFINDHVGCWSCAGCRRRGRGGRRRGCGRTGLRQNERVRFGPSPDAPGHRQRILCDLVIAFGCRILLRPHARSGYQHQDS